MVNNIINKKINEHDAAEILKSFGNTYILIHQLPDGDCIGSGFALKYYFESTGRKAKVICCDDIPDRFNFMTDENNTDFVPDNIMSVDVADPKLFGSLEEKYADQIELSIDHHASDTPFAKNICTDSTASAAAQVLCRVFDDMDYKINRKQAVCIYTAVATDTGCFQYSNVHADTMLLISEIMRKFPDIDYATINRLMFTVKSKARIKLEMLAMENMEEYFDGKVVIITITQKQLDECGLDSNDLEGLANIPLELETAKLGITIKEYKPDFFKISFRSVGNVNAAEIASRIGGGGHFAAAGAAMEGTADEVKRKILACIKHNNL